MRRQFWEYVRAHHALDEKVRDLERMLCDVLSRPKRDPRALERLAS
jgi:hypothetical protein